MPFSQAASEKRISEEDPATPPRSKRYNTQPSPTRPAKTADITDPENYTLEQLQAPPLPTKPHDILPDQKWAQSLLEFRMLVPDEWWNDFSGDCPNPAEIVRCDPQDSRYFYFRCDGDSEDMEKQKKTTRS